VHARLRPAPGVRALLLPVPDQPAGAWTAGLTTTEGVYALPFEVPADPPALTLSLSAPVGQPPATVYPGDEIAVSLLDGAPAPVALTVSPRRAGPLVVSRDGAPLWSGEAAAGAPVLVQWTLQDDDQVEVTLGGLSTALRLRAQPLPRADAQAAVGLRALHLPADPRGAPRPGRSPDRLHLPAPWWRAALGALGLGTAARDPWAPFAYAGVEVHNSGPHDLQLSVSLRVEDGGGQPAPAFRPRLRGGEAETGAVRALLRVPAGGAAVAALPIYLDEGALPEGEGALLQQAVVELRALGGPALLHSARRPFALARGSTWASAGLALALGAGAAGALLIALRLRAWLRLPTATLMTIALFSSLSLIVSAGARLFATGLASLLGPLSVLVSGLVDDVLRVTLLATLLMLCPRRGVAALHALVGWLLGGVVLGDFSPTDVILVGGRALWLELGAALSGLSAGPAWTQGGRLSRWLRLSLGLGLAQLGASAAGVALHTTLYRLFMADWYVILVLAGPGFLYVALAAALSLPFAEALRRVQR
jgi:hypothetical protein